VSPIEIFAAFLLIAGSGLVLRAVMAADRGAPQIQQPRATEVTYRKAA
jgi:hypothetical protein